MLAWEKQVRNTMMISGNGDLKMNRVQIDLKVF
jgi:hypothetical protein